MCIRDSDLERDYDYIIKADINIRALEAFSLRKLTAGLRGRLIIYEISSVSLRLHNASC